MCFHFYMVSSTWHHSESHCRPLSMSEADNRISVFFCYIGLPTAQKTKLKKRVGGLSARSSELQTHKSSFTPVFPMKKDSGSSKRVSKGFQFLQKKARQHTIQRKYPTWIESLNKITKNNSRTCIHTCPFTVHCKLYIF